MIQASYLLAAVLFIFGLRRMSTPKGARGGIIWAGAGMLIATAITFFWPGLGNYLLITIALVLGAAISAFAGRRVAMTDMPQMIALFNGMGGGAAAGIAGVELLRGEAAAADVLSLAVLGAVIGTVSFSGSLIAFAKLQGLIRRSVVYRWLQALNLILLAAALGIGIYMVVAGAQTVVLITLFFVLSLVVGVLMTLPIGGADMPVVISLYNALTGLAVGFEGYVLGNAAMIVAGTVVGAAGSLLTQLMAKAMNRSLGNVLFSGFGATGGQESTGAEGEMKPMSVEDAAVMLAYSRRVIIAPGYGMAVAQAQHKVWELVQQLQARGVDVKFAVHPVAGRMPGHMNVLLAEAGVPYDLIYDLDEINSDFPNTDVSIVIGANDVVNPAARTDTGSPIYGMPILNVDQSKNVLVVKRGRGTGFAGIENRLFVGDNTNLLFGDAQKVANDLVQAVKRL